jgi:hypothetical protein
MDPRAVMDLLARGADPDDLDKKTGKSALRLMASDWDRPIDLKAVEAMLAAGADPGFRSEDGYCAIDEARRSGSAALALFLEARDRAGAKPGKERKSPRKMSLEFFRNCARIKGGECLSEKYSGAASKLRFRCADGHEWETKAAHVACGTWCPKCAGNFRLPIEAVRRVARSRGGECLSEESPGASAKLRFRCSEGHEWEALAGNVWSKGSWCPRCAGRGSYSIEEFREFARDRSGECLSDECHGARSILRMRCSQGHEWELAAGTVRSQRTWCRKCSTKEKAQERGIASANRRAGKADRMLAESKGGRLLRAGGAGESRWREFVCAEGHQFRIGEDRGGRERKKWCPVCRAARNKPPAGLGMFMGLAKDKGGECLSSEFSGWAGPLLMRCAHGHEFESRPDSLSKGSWCPQCAGNKRAPLDEWKRLAAERGGECLGEIPGKKLSLRCSCGHEWAPLKQHFKAGSWCPACARKKRKAEEKPPQ